MSTFNKKKIESEIVSIIDIWSYKIRVAICKFTNENIELLWFSEKRQSSLDIVNNEIKNLEWVCENISLALKKAEDQAKIKTNKIALNPVFWNTFFSAKKITHIRKDKFKLISENELKDITKKVEEISYLSATKKIFKDYLYPSSDLEIIVSNISKIVIDNEVIKDPLQKNWEKISFNLLNIFLSKNNIELLNYISKYLKKDLVKILPEEFCLSKIWEKQKEVTIIDIWNSSSYVTIKDSSNNIKWSLKISVWIESLINIIKEKSDYSRIEIIKKINRDDFFQKEKKEFLGIYCYLIWENLKEIMWDEIVPNNFFIIWWWWNNAFLKNYIEKYDFSDQIKINSKIKFIVPNVTKIWKIDNVESILNKSNLNIIAMILTYKEILSHKSDKVEQYLQNAIKEIIKEN